MLQEATKILNSAFHNSFIKRLSLYLHDCVREEVKSSTFRNLKQDKDNKWIFLQGEEQLFNNFSTSLALDGSDSSLTELMIQAEMSQKDKYLIYGYLFLVGKSAKSKKKNEFLTPLLYMSCKLEREGLNIKCSLQDEVLSLNTGALTALIMKSDDEDEMEYMLDGLLEAVPDLPLTQDKLDIFITTLKAIVPDLEIKLNHEEDELENCLEGDFEPKMAGVSAKANAESLDDFIEDVQILKPAINLDKVALTNQSAIILTKRPSVTAGVLHELTQISEKPSGIFRETALNVINEEYLRGKGKLGDRGTKLSKSLRDFTAITPLALSDSQEDVIKKIEENPLLSVYGPPGTGKSQTIVNLVAHLIANGKTVLVASRMDKAVDVVAERLNELGAPFLALRAGRINYQKQLSFHLQDLLSNKVDLDTGYENSILTDVDDMRVLLNSVTEFEEKCEKIINLELEWQELTSERNLQEQTIGKPVFITKTLKKDEIAIIENILDSFEKSLEKSGFFTGLKIKVNSFNLRRLLGLIDFNVDYENVERLKLELNLSNLACKARLIEAKIHKIGNLHALLEQIKMLRKKQRTLAVEILKTQRRESLKGLLRVQEKRQRLIIHTKAIVERKKNLQNRLLEAEDFKPLLEAFPCWCVTTYAISGSLPMKPGLFDVVVLDEASQCDIASCFPILYRAKKAVIVGDDKQLPHLSFLEKAKEQSFLSQYDIPDKYQLMWRFRTNSMFDLSNYYSTNPVLLDEHFRSLKPIIKFSNSEFYGNRIRIMNKQTDVKDALELVLVDGGKVDNEQTRNFVESEALVKKIHEIILDDRNNKSPVSIGVISPFRAQVELLKKDIMQVIPEGMIKRHKIEVGTAHTFQGDERDIILISWAIAPNSHSQSLTFLQKPNLFNVAITRARKKLVCFLSKNPKDLPSGLLRDYIDYIQNFAKKVQYDVAFDENIYKNDFEKVVAKTLREKGFKVKAGVEAAGFSTDLLVSSENVGSENSIIVECDGMEDSEKCSNTQIKKQTILERCGFKVLRLTYREWYHSSNACVERVSHAIS